MTLTIIDQFGKLLTNGFDVVETWERHIAIEIGGRGTWVDGEYLNRGVRLESYLDVGRDVRDAFHNDMHGMYLFAVL